jgi:acetate kinase
MARLMKLLVLNAGSSSQKTALFELSHTSSHYPVQPIWQGKLDWDGTTEKLTIRNSQGKEIREERDVSADKRHLSLEAMLSNLCSGADAVVSKDQIDGVGHRIVHGGAKLTDPVLIDATVKETISSVADIAPLHNAAGLRGIEIAQRFFPGKPQVAVFDTGFHKTLPDYAYVYPGPFQWVQRGIRRYGFHGINHQYCAMRAADMLERDLSSLKIVSCHLGNGCSLAAIHNGKSVNTSMGFTPLDGVMMGTRGGSVDPGILVYLLRTDHIGPNELDDLLNYQSGLLGVSGISSDMRDILDAISRGNERARLAFDIFVHRVATEAAAMASSMNGMDVLVFTAGIGENSPAVREAVCTKLEFLGIELETTINSSAITNADLASPNSRVRVLTIQAQEDWAVARECAHILATEPCQSPFEQRT